jgi:hypothetical protein
MNIFFSFVGSYNFVSFNSRFLDHGDFIFQFEMVPRNYKFPADIKLKTIWGYWWMGDRSKISFASEN